MKEQTSVKPELTPLNYKQLAAMYRITPKTLKSWLRPFEKEIGTVHGRILNLRQLRIIYARLGEPEDSAA